MLENIFYQILDPIPSYVIALVLLCIAYLVAKFAMGITTKLLGRISLKKLGDNEETVKKTIAKAVYLIVFLLFLPSVFTRIGLSSVASPISELISALVGYIPNVVAAGIILVIGLFLTKTLKDLLLPIIKLTKVDNIQEKAGIEVTEKTSLSYIITSVISAFALLLVITCALDCLNIPTITGPLNGIVSSVFAFVPNLLGALVVIIIGLFVTKLTANLLESLLVGIGTDKLAGKLCCESAPKISLSKAIATVTKVIMAVIVIVQGLNILELPVFVQIGAAILAYIPTALSVLLILVAGLFAAKAVTAAISKAYPDAKIAPVAAKGAIYAVMGFIILSQLNIATKIVENTFVLCVAAVCLAAAIAFGIGGKTFAANLLAKLEDKTDKN